ncbi:MAG: hypothetical protein GF311_13475 [Candidatus Lokiarchaeota archaeon]|nr:hypothetical protein [Candidatus Lokiarchaeota archaeon]
MYVPRKLSDKCLFIAFFVLFCLNGIISVALLCKNNFGDCGIQISQNSNQSVNLSHSFEFTEFTEANGSKACYNQIDIELPDEDWNLTDLEMNFTDIKMGKEIKIIEENDSDFGVIWYQNVIQKKLGLSVQLKITIPTTIFGVYIYGRTYNEPSQDISFGFQEYDDINNKPTGTEIRSKILNISNTWNWYYQDFHSNPITLSVGNYSLVMINQNYSDKSAEYHWAINDINPKISNLHTSEYDETWSNGVTNQTFLYKLVQTTNETYNPLDINMTANINDNHFIVQNRTSMGSGKLSFKNRNIPYYTQNLHISILNNISVELKFNISYRLRINNKFSEAGSLLIREGMVNTWRIINPFHKVGENYSIRLYFPNHWYNPSVFKDGQNKTDDENILIRDNFLLILHNLIDDAQFNISFNSDNKDLGIYVPKSKYLAGEEITISVNPPDMAGNVSFIMLYSEVFEEYMEEREVISDTITFRYNLPKEGKDGNWLIQVYWVSDTDAGYQTYSISVTLPPNPMIIVWSLVFVIIGIIASFSTYVGIKRYRHIKIERRKKQINQYLDILKLNYIMISHKNSGLNIYERSFMGDKIDPTLVSGYLNAFKIFGLELAGSYQKTQTAKLEYQNLKIIMSDYKNIRTIVILNGEPSKDFLDITASLSYEIESTFEDELEKFKGDRTRFKGLEEIINSYLNIEFILPLKISATSTTELTNSQLWILEKAQNIIKKNQLRFFFVSFLFPNQEFNYKIAETISQLIDKQIFIPSN